MDVALVIKDWFTLHIASRPSASSVVPPTIHRLRSYCKLQFHSFCWFPFPVKGWFTLRIASHPSASSVKFPTIHRVRRIANCNFTGFFVDFRFRFKAKLRTVSFNNAYPSRFFPWNRNVHILDLQCVYLGWGHKLIKFEHKPTYLKTLSTNLIFRQQ